MLSFIRTYNLSNIRSSFLTYVVQLLLWTYTGILLCPQCQNFSIIQIIVCKKLWHCTCDMLKLYVIDQDRMCESKNALFVSSKLCCTVFISLQLVLTTCCRIKSQSASLSVQEEAQQAQKKTKLNSEGWAFTDFHGMPTGPCCAHVTPVFQDENSNHCKTKQRRWITGSVFNWKASG